MFHMHKEQKEALIESGEHIKDCMKKLYKKCILFIYKNKNNKNAEKERETEQQGRTRYRITYSE